MVLRVFAGQIELSPAEYAEAEAGVVRWLGEDQQLWFPRCWAFPRRNGSNFWRF